MTTFAYSGGALNNLVGNTPGANVSNLVTLLNDLKNFLNAPNLDGTNIADIPEGLLALALQQKLGLNDGGQIGRGSSIIATTESRTNTAYGLLTTPDRVQNVVVPADGLLAIGYHAIWQNSASVSGRAAIFIGANQLQYWVAGPGMLSQEINGPTPTGADHLISTCGVGLNTAQAATYTGDVSTGQVIGQIGAAQFTDAGVGVVYVRVPAGTYTISVQFKATTGSVTVKNRRLWVWTMGF